MADLISRAAAIECAIDAVDDWDGGWNPNRETVIRKYFEEVPAVEAVPVVHGRWIEKRWTKEYDWGCTNHFSVVCSACSKEIYKGMKSPYCPNCGAKMDGEQRLAFADQSGAEYADNPTV